MALMGPNGVGNPLSIMIVSTSTGQVYNSMAFQESTASNGIATNII